VAHTINVAREAEHWGLTFGKPQVDLNRLRAWKESILEKLGNGVSQLAQRRQVPVLRGRAHFEDSTTLRVETKPGPTVRQVREGHRGHRSKAAMPKAFDLGNPRIMTSTEALEVEEVPGSLLVVGGGLHRDGTGHGLCTLGSQVVVGGSRGQHPERRRSGSGPAHRQPGGAAVQGIRTSVKVLDMATKGPQIAS